MQSLKAAGDKQKRSSEWNTYTQYLALPTETKDVATASRGSFGFRNRYLAKRRLLRTIRRIRHEHA